MADKAPPDQMIPREVLRPLTVRQSQIVGSAAGLFHRFGYDRVTLDLIAGNLGMRGPAIYRHFNDKQSILRAVINESFVEVEDVVAAAEAASLTDSRQAATDMLEGMIEIGIRHREFGVMWQRESRYLSGDAVTHFRDRFLEASRLIGEVLGRSRPELQDQYVDLLAWAALSITSSPSYHSYSLPPRRFRQTLFGMVSRVCLDPAIPLTDWEPASSDPEAGVIDRFDNRREQILFAASRLFADTGFQSVTMGDIGRAAGLAGPSIYNHFENKVDILIAAFVRATDLLEAGTGRPPLGSDPLEHLEKTIASYVALAFEHSHLVSMLVTEVQHLPEAERRQVERLIAHFDEQWVDLLVSINPRLKRTVVRFMVRTIHTLVNDVVRIPHLRRRPGAKETLELLAREVALSVPA